MDHNQAQSRRQLHKVTLVRTVVLPNTITFLYSFVPCGKFGSPYLDKAQQPQEQRYPLLAVCAVFSCVQKLVRFVTCSQMLIRVSAHGSCMDTVSEYAVKIYSGRKIPCRTGDSNLCQCSVWLFSRTL